MSCHFLFQLQSLLQEKRFQNLNAFTVLGKITVNGTIYDFIAWLFVFFLSVAFRESQKERARQRIVFQLKTQRIGLLLLKAQSEQGKMMLSKLLHNRKPYKCLPSLCQICINLQCEQQKGQMLDQRFTKIFYIYLYNEKASKFSISNASQIVQSYYLLTERQKISIKRGVA